MKTAIFFVIMGLLTITSFGCKTGKGCDCPTFGKIQQPLENNINFAKS